MINKVSYEVNEFQRFYEINNEERIEKSMLIIIIFLLIPLYYYLIILNLNSIQKVVA